MAIEQPAVDDVAQQGEARVARVLTWVAGAIALLVALAGPGAYFWLSWNAGAQDAEVSARLHAAFAMQAMSRSRSDWRNDVQGLVDERLVVQPLPEHRRIIDLAGQVITQSDGPLSGLEVRATVPLVNRDGVVATLELARSMRPLVEATVIVALASMALGAAIFCTLRLLPLRALSRALRALADEQMRSRRQLEQYVNVLFEDAVDGIVVFDLDGTVRSCNPRAARMLGEAACDVVGRPLSRWLRPTADTTSGFAIGTAETAGCRRTAHGRSAFPCEVSVSSLPAAAGGADGLVVTLRDLTDRRQAEEQQNRLANYDSLTGLPNRGLFRDRLDAAMRRARASGSQMALMFLDLDRFKTVNDSLGHDAGDKLLQHVAHLLTTCLRGGDAVGRWSPGEDNGFVVARLGGDEFTVIVEGLSGPGPALAIAERIRRALEQPFFVGGEEIVITTSMGITLFPLDDSSREDLLKHADLAMYRAKDLGRNACQLYSEELNADAAMRLQLETRLRHALHRGEFVLHYQPKADLRTGGITGVEALLRWRPDGDLLVAPDRFIRVLEETGLIVPVGQWVLREAVRQAAAWDASGLPPLSMAVNLSARQLRQDDLVQQVRDALAGSGLRADRLQLELTESMLMDGDAFRHTLRGLSDLGVKLAIDDFGTGYSSLGYLKRFYVDTLKIDRSFVRHAPDDVEDGAIATAVIALARSLRLSVVAEGVETEAQALFLRRQGCDEMQGYLLSPPLPAGELAAWLALRTVSAPLTAHAA